MIVPGNGVTMARHADGPSRGLIIMKHDLRDLALRSLILVAGGLSALLLALKGHGEALPAVAVGGALGAFFATRVQQTTTED